MLKVKILQDDDDYILFVEGEDDYVFSALCGLGTILPADALGANGDGLLRIRGSAVDYFSAWLTAVRISHHAEVVWLPIAAATV